MFTPSQSYKPLRVQHFVRRNPLYPIYQDGHKVKYPLKSGCLYTERQPGIESRPSERNSPTSDVCHWKMIPCQHLCRQPVNELKHPQERLSYIPAVHTVPTLPNCPYVAPRQRPCWTMELPTMAPVKSTKTFTTSEGCTTCLQGQMPSVSRPPSPSVHYRKRHHARSLTPNAKECLPNAGVKPSIMRDCQTNPLLISYQQLTTPLQHALHSGSTCRKELKYNTSCICQALKGPEPRCLHCCACRSKSCIQLGHWMPVPRFGWWMLVNACKCTGC